MKETASHLTNNIFPAVERFSLPTSVFLRVTKTVGHSANFIRQAAGGFFLPASSFFHVAGGFCHVKKCPVERAFSSPTPLENRVKASAGAGFKHFSAPLPATLKNTSMLPRAPGLVALAAPTWKRSTTRAMSWEMSRMLSAAGFVRGAVMLAWLTISLLEGGAMARDVLVWRCLNQARVFDESRAGTAGRADGNHPSEPGALPGTGRQRL